jgi:1-acyl-sn-glycerol-3-phosphate acyltransferase
MYSVPWYNRLARLTLRPVVRVVFHLLSRVQIQGLENVPAQAPYIAVFNHISYYEPPFVLSFWPRPLEPIGAAEIWHKPGQSLLAHLHGGIRIQRGAINPGSLKAALAALHNGYPLLLAPEGGRTHQTSLQQPFPGVAYLAERGLSSPARAGSGLNPLSLPIVPVGIVGAHDDFLSQALRGRRPALSMQIGPAFTLPQSAFSQPAGPARQAALQANADFVMRQLAAQLPRDYHGHYA